jgi:diacylglycerol kinase (ATP)
MSIGIVVNPAAGGGRLGAVWPELRRLLEARLGPVSVLETRHAGEGRDLAAQHVRNGAALVIAAGGDGTANEVVDGLLLAGGGPELGVISVGTGRDFIRTLGGTQGTCGCSGGDRLGPNAADRCGQGQVHRR